MSKKSFFLRDTSCARMRKLTNAAAVALVWLAVCFVVPVAECGSACEHESFDNWQKSTSVGALPPPVSRSSLFYQLVSDALHQLHPGVLVEGGHGHVVYARELEPYIVQGFLQHNYTNQDALEALNMSVSLHPGQRNRHGQRLGPGTPTSRGGSPHDAGNWVERAPINGAMLLPTYHVRRTVWLLWFQGWGSAPWLVQEVAKSWERHNPGWEVVRLDKQNLGKYMNTKFLFDPANKLQAAAQSDLVRLRLLSRYGGVWADATILCFAPLDSWVYPAVRPVGLWMYHGRDNCSSLASWFIVAAANSYIMQTWSAYSWFHWRRQVADPAFKNNNTRLPYKYFWMDALWAELLTNDRVFRLHWQQVPKLCCEERGQSHMLAGKVARSDLELKSVIADNPPWVMKLDWKSFPAEYNDGIRSTNGYYAIMQSYRQRVVRHVLQTKSCA